MPKVLFRAGDQELLVDAETTTLAVAEAQKRAGEGVQVKYVRTLDWDEQAKGSDTDDPAPGTVRDVRFPDEDPYK